MECRKVRKYLALYLDSELGPETTFEISSHLEECEACRRVTEQEERLESRLRAVLTRPYPEDDRVWSRAAGKALGAHGSRRYLRPKQIAMMVIATAAGVALLLAWNRWSHHELDLAAAVAAAHSDFLEVPRQQLDVSGDIEAIESYFQHKLAPAFQLNTPLPTEHLLVGGSVCGINGVRTAHLVCSGRPEPVSVFWMPLAHLDVFPETVARMEQAGPAFHCSVTPFEFYVRRTTTAVVAAVGSATPSDLQSLVDSLCLPRTNPL